MMIQALLLNWFLYSTVRETEITFMDDLALQLQAEKYLIALKAHLQHLSPPE